MAFLSFHFKERVNLLFNDGNLTEQELWKIFVKLCVWVRIQVLARSSARVCMHVCVRMYMYTQAYML